MVPRVFGLDHEPWLSMVDRQGGAREVGLFEALAEAHTLRRVAGEAPPMTSALYRLLLALAHRVYGPATADGWAELWRAESLPVEPLAAYFARYGDRFDLFSPDWPFLQCPPLARCAFSNAAKLVPWRSVGNNATLFDHTTATDPIELTASEAARWLATVQAYDPGGMKTPYVKDKSSERALGNNFGCVLVEGATLKETLLLNLQRYDPRAELPRMTTEKDRPAWEAEPPNPLPTSRAPLGWTDLLTWPSRRILLSHKDSDAGPVVDGVVIAPGTRLKAELIDVESMAAYRRPSTAAGRSRKAAPPMVPVRLNEHRGVWRHSVELLLAGGRDRHAVRDRQRPAALDEIAERVGDDLIPSDTIYTLRVFGQQLDRYQSAVECWMEEAVPAPVALMRAEDGRIGKLIGNAVRLADDVGTALRTMEAGYRAEFKADPSSQLDLAYWPKLSTPFGPFLTALSDAVRNGTTEVPSLTRWRSTVNALGHAAAQTWVNGSSRQGRQLLAAGQHYGNFTGRLSKLMRQFDADTAAYVVRQEAV